MDEKEKIAMDYAKTKMGFIERRLKQNTKYNVLKYIVINGPNTIIFPPEGGSKDLLIKSNTEWSVASVNPSNEFENLFE